MNLEQKVNDLEKRVADLEKQAAAATTTDIDWQRLAESWEKAMIKNRKNIKRGVAY